MGAATMTELRGDIFLLRGLIDVALDRAVPFDDPLLHACAGILYERRSLLAELESSSA